MNFNRDSETIKIRGRTVFISSGDESLGERLTKLPGRIGSPLTITSTSRHHARNPRRPTTKYTTYFCVLRGVHRMISEEDVKDALEVRGPEAVKVWRIISRQTNKPTSLIRIFSLSDRVIAELLQKGLKILGEIICAEASHPPLDQPTQCSRCLQFHGLTTPCEREPACGLFSGEHATSKCQQQEPQIKCANCGGDHAAFSHSCPRRPKALRSRAGSTNQVPRPSSSTTCSPPRASASWPSRKY
ncbi:PREDICTED: nucleic-acid-binding protein from mobile element jockey-like [Nicrophorus vespilloides]|uniref:Nucleic-acid-binding protein from mobile element jockey-like n=1 Tax=Nicrophorus vespilloides TaxID=110193 RepID=A0ABM1N462_NICVS|nr:PREDICTED: nucleic-acid-binding protein from mobile element jockey-like [Nicrophorus vespilloides]